MVYILPRSKVGSRFTGRSMPPEVESNVNVYTRGAGWGQSLRSKNKSRAFYEAIYGKVQTGTEGLELGYGSMSEEYAAKWLDSQDMFYRQPVITVMAVQVPDVDFDPQSTVRHKGHAALPATPASRVDLSGHKLTLLDSPSTHQTPANILEVLSAGRQPLPPALARALERLHSPRKPSLRPLKVRHGLLEPPPPSGFPRPLRPSVESPEDSLVGLFKSFTLAKPTRQGGSKDIKPTHAPPTHAPLTAQPAVPKITAGSFLKFLAVPLPTTTTTPPLHMPTVANTRKVANMKTNSYFASSGASSAGSTDTDTLSKLFDKYRGQCRNHYWEHS